MSRGSLRVLVVGVGLHAVRAHLPILVALSSKAPLHMVAALDLESAGREARARLDVAGLTGTRLYGLRGPIEAHGASAGLDAVLDEIVVRHDINTVVIATEAESHWPYVQWAVRRNLHVLVDKPVLAVQGASTDAGAARELVRQVDWLASALPDHAAVARVLVHRRANPAYRRVRDEIARVTEQTGCHVTGLMTEHSDGEWRMPSELLRQRYHRVDRGMGVLSHSGYHVLDSTLWWLRASGLPGTPRVTATSVDPIRAFGQVPDTALLHAFGDTAPSMDRVAAAQLDVEWGEWDAHLRFEHEDGDRLLSRSDLHLLHSGFSHRGWVSSEGRDLYTGNGRVGHEIFSLHQGPFQAIKVFALQGGMLSSPASPYDVEGPRHCEMHIFRNTHFVEGQQYERVSLDELELPTEDEFLGLGPGKVLMYQEFVEAALLGRRTSPLDSSLLDHLDVMRTYAGCCEALAGARALAAAP